LAVGVLG